MPAAHGRRRLLLFTKPALPGRVKTRLVGDLTATQAAELHAAFVADMLTCLTPGRFDLVLAWALEPGERMPRRFWPGVAGTRQRGSGLGERLHSALRAAARRAPVVAALGSDLPTVSLQAVEQAFAAIESGAAQVVLGPAEDGGYYLIALAAGAVRPRLFADIPWSTAAVLAATLARCAELGLTVELLPPAADVDTPADLARLAGALAPPGPAAAACPRTRALLARWGRLGAAPDPAAEVACPPSARPPVARPAPRGGSLPCGS